MATGAKATERWTGLAVRIMSHEVADDAEVCAKTESRSVGKQIEYWARIGKRALENPDMTIRAVQNMIKGEEQYRAGKMVEFDPLAS